MTTMSQSTALLLTLLFELSVLTLWWRFRNGERHSWRRFLMAGIAASCLTHPFAWWANETVARVFPQWTRLGLIEVSVFMLEGVFYAYVLPLSLRRGLSLSLLANATSFGVGLLIFMWLRA